jgi:predicted nucleic acid-binding protein
MTTFVDTSVLIDLVTPTAEHHQWCKGAIENARLEGPVIVSDAVYSEFSITMDSEEQTDQVLSELALQRCVYSNRVLFRAGRAYAAYKKNKGTKNNVLPDFYIGALADVEGAPLVTRDTGKVHTYFPQVRLIAP